MFLAVSSAVAVSALPVTSPVRSPVTLPVRVAVIVPAAKLPDASRMTKLFAELAELDVIVINGLPATPFALLTPIPDPLTAIERSV